MENILKTGGSNSSSFWATIRKAAGNQSSGIECVQDTHGATTTSPDIVKESVANYFEALYQMHDPLDFGIEWTSHMEDQVKAWAQDTQLRSLKLHSGNSMAVILT